MSVSQKGSSLSLSLLVFKVALMREEASTGAMDPLLLQRSSSPPPTPAASSVGASSPSVPANVGSIDWSVHGRCSRAGSLSAVGSQLPRTSFSTSAGNSAPGVPHPSCRPWERSDLLRRLASFKPSNWSGKPKVASLLACAQRGWMSVDIDKIACELCGVHLTFTLSPTWTPREVDGAGEAFAKQLDSSHRGSCPWRGNSCARSLAQFPPTPPSALVGGYKDRCDALLQFPSLPVIASSALEHIRLSWGPQINYLLSQSNSSTVEEVNGRMESMPGGAISQDETIYIHAQKLISLCGWEPRWLPNVADYEENSTQSARNACSVGTSQYKIHPSDPGPSKQCISASAKKDTGKQKISVPESGHDSRLALLDCSLCGATVRLWDFLLVPRPARIAPNIIDIPETSKKLTRGVSAASGINGWVAADGMDKDQIEGRDEVATTDAGRSPRSNGLDLNLTMAGGLSSIQCGMPSRHRSHHETLAGQDLVSAQPTGSEVGDRAASYESRGPRTRKRSLDEGGSTVDRPHQRTHHADSVEGTVIDRDGDEVDDCRRCSDGPSKCMHDSDAFYTYQTPTGVGPSHAFGFDLDIEVNKIDPFRQEGKDQFGALPSARDSARASSVIAMDTVCHNADRDSMESVENHPGDIDDVHSNPQDMYRNLEMNDVSELNISLQAQQSTCLQPEFEAVREARASSTDEGEETLNADNVTGHGRDRFSFGISGGSVGMVASHEAEIHGIDFSVHRTESVVGDIEPVAEVIETLGQTGESIPERGLMDEFVSETERGDAHGDSHDMMSHSVGRADSGSKIDYSTKAESMESGEKASHMFSRQNSGQNSLTCNAVIYSGYEVSKGEVTQTGKVSHTGQTNGESNYDEAGEFDPIEHHHHFCPWINGNVAAAGCLSGAGTTSDAPALCGWQLTLDALDAFQSLEHIPVQPVESESAASLYKDDRRNPVQKLLARRSASKGSKGHR